MMKSITTEVNYCECFHESAQLHEEFASMYRKCSPYTSILTVNECLIAVLEMFPVLWKMLLITELK